MKIAIIGAGPAGLACAKECETLGVIPDVFERDHSVGWVWPSMVLWPDLYTRNWGDIRKVLREEYGIDITPMATCKTLAMKSPGHKATIKGNIGFLVARGKGVESIENQMLRSLRKTTVHFNRPANFRELSQKYDYVVVASGKDTEAAELGVWNDLGQVTIIGGVALGNYDHESTTLFFNKDYAGSGYARLSPFSPTQAIVGLYIINHEPFAADRLFSKFLKQENLEHLEFLYVIRPPVFPTGRVTKFRVGNVLLAGRSAGLTEKLLGVGGISAIISGVLAARAIIKGLDYDSLMKPLQDHIDNISSFRKVIENFENKDYDRLLMLLDSPGIKQAVYNTGINFMDMAGSILKKLRKDEGER